jgi:hypothetical protein
LKAAREENERLSGFNNTMRLGARMLREVMGMPAQGEGYVMEKAAEQIAAFRARLAAADDARLERVRECLRARLLDTSCDRYDIENIADAVLAADAVPVPAPEVEWTTEPPTEPGWYWFRAFEDDDDEDGIEAGVYDPLPVEIVKDCGTLYARHGDEEVNISACYPTGEWWTVRISEPPTKEGR